MTNIKKGWSPPGQGLTGPRFTKRWVIPTEAWQEAWKAFYAGDDEQVSELMWEHARLPPELVIRFFKRLSTQSEADNPKKGNPTRQEIELGSNIVFLPMYRVLHTHLDDPLQPEGFDSNAVRPTNGEIVFSALRSLGYPRPFIWDHLDWDLMMAKLLELHVRDDRVVAVPPRARKIPSQDGTP